MKPLTTNTGRRRLLQAMASGGLLAGLEMYMPGIARADVMQRATQGARVQGGAPRAISRDLHIRAQRIAIAGGQAIAHTIDNGVPGPLIELWEGFDARLRVHNHLRDAMTSLHWHGILLPFEMDGVPGVSFPGIAAGDTFEAAFPVRQSGTYWYHSHAGFQEQTGQIGPLVIHPAGGERQSADRDYVLVLSDWTFEDPARLFAKLKESSDYYNFNQRTLDDLAHEIAVEGWAHTLDTRLAWNRMRMSPRDIADVTGATYTYLMNGQHPAANWTGVFTPGERIRLRVINASSMTYFNVRIPGLPLTVVAADGQPIEPVETDEFQIAVAETYDLIVTPPTDTAYTIMAESMDRSGYARGTLAPRHGMQATVPALRTRPTRSMVDMGMPMKGMENGAPSAMHDMPSSHASSSSSSPHQMMSMGTMSEKPAINRATMPQADALAHSGMDNAGPVIAHHDNDQHGPGNITVAQVQRDRLGDRPTGLADVAHRVLTYDQLRNITTPPDARAPTQTIEVHLTGNMNRYMWSFNGREFSHAEPIEFPFGARIRLILVNDTMMEHPIHLHGMFMELENRHADRRPYKHTVSVLPGSRVSLLITADEPGRWAFHCHLLYHMEAGMFRVVRVAPTEALDHA